MSRYTNRQRIISNNKAAKINRLKYDAAFWYINLCFMFYYVEEETFYVSMRNNGMDRAYNNIMLKLIRILCVLLYEFMYGLCTYTN